MTTLSLERAVRDLTSLTNREIEDIKSRMWKEGLKNTTKKDAIVYHYLGNKLYCSLSESSFNYSCLEAEYLGIPQVNEDFIHMCKVNRESAWDTIIKQLPYVIEREIILSPANETEMKKHIFNKYKRQKGRKINIDFN